MKIPLVAAFVLLLVGCGRASLPLAQVPEQPQVAPTSSAAFSQPLDRAADRVTKKQFGTRVTPQSSPVQPEWFSGYHTGVDYETFPEEAEVDVPVRAVCAGPLFSARTASGYGGVAVQSCELGGDPVTVVYGHLRLTSITAKAGDRLAAGDTFGVLGTGYSRETDGERKHLHLAIYRGGTANIRGYVATSAELSGWIDPTQAF